MQLKYPLIKQKELNINVQDSYDMPKINKGRIAQLDAHYRGTNLDQVSRNASEGKLHVTKDPIFAISMANKKSA